jgi:hypothetical protein
MSDPMACDPHSLTRGERDIYQKGVFRGVRVIDREMKRMEK